jgi:hypothetical protein
MAPLDVRFGTTLEEFAKTADRALPEAIYMDGRWLTWSEVDAIVHSLVTEPVSDEEARKIEQEAGEWWEEQHKDHVTPDPEGYCPLCYPEYHYDDKDTHP